MSDLNWNLRDIIYVFKDSRLPVFISIFLHKNTRNRSWPSNELIAEETGLSSAPISAAIGWMIESNVVVLVPFNKRVGLETKLPNRKNIYQLSGVVLVDGNYYPYMNLTPEGWQSIAADLEGMGNSLLSKQLNDVDSLLSKCLESKRLFSKHKGIKELDSEGVKGIEGIKSIPGASAPETKEPTAKVSSSKKNTTPAELMNPMKDAIAEAFGWEWAHMTKSEMGIVQATAKELCTAGFEADRVASLHAWCKAKFTHFTPRAMASHLSEYRASRIGADSKPAYKSLIKHD
jgi:hypothetical protein